jgi:hypothetical protein
MDTQPAHKNGEGEDRQALPAIIHAPVWRSGPEAIQSALFARGGPIIPASVVVNQVDDDVPHDQTSLFGWGLR